MNENTIVTILLKQRIRLSAVMWTIVRDTHAAEDLFQELLVKAMSERDRFSDEDQLVAWATIAAKHRAIDYVRIRDGRTRILQENVLELLSRQLDSQPNELLESRLDALRECVEALPSRSRSLIAMRYDAGLSGTEMAKQLKRTRDAVYQSLSRLHRGLRDCVDSRLGWACQNPPERTQR